MDAGGPLRPEVAAESDINGIRTSWLCLVYHLGNEIYLFILYSDYMIAFLTSGEVELEFKFKNLRSFQDMARLD